MSSCEDIAKRLNQLKSTLPSSVTLVAVTKYSPFSDIKCAYDAGHRDFGENRVDDLLEKAEQAKQLGMKDIRWHMIGHLQSNKINKLAKVPGLFSIHSIDSLSLLQKLIQKQDQFESQLKIFLEINTSGEEEKGGFRRLSEIQEAAQLLIQEGQRFDFFGLMTMATIRTEDLASEATRCFSELRSTRDYLEQRVEKQLRLSMGMSGDYHQALKEGSDFIRIGSAIFKGE